jgi:hypothetical protein
MSLFFTDADRAMMLKIHRQLINVSEQLDTIEGMVRKEMGAIEDLTAQVAQNTSVDESAVTLIQGLAAQIAAAGTDPAKLAALQTNLKASADKLAAAVAANTPAAPPA